MKEGCRWSEMSAAGEGTEERLSHYFHRTQDRQGAIYFYLATNLLDMSNVREIQKWRHRDVTLQAIACDDLYREMDQFR